MLATARRLALSAAQCAKLVDVSIDAKTTGITSLAALKKLPNLRYVTVGKGMFPNAELAGFCEGLRSHSVSLREMGMPSDNRRTACAARSR